MLKAQAVILPRMRFLIGTYTDQTDSAGIYVIDNGQDDRFEVLAQATIWLRNASYLIEHPVLPLVYAVSEIGEAPGGQVAILRQDDEGHYGLWQIIASGGLDPCHLSLSPNGRTLLISHYSSGSIAVQGIAPDGSFEPNQAIVRHDARHAAAQALGRGRHPRQAAAHVHSATFLKDHQFAVCDLGTDEVLLYDLAPNRSLQVTLRQCWTLPAGSGPRHLVASSERLYVIAELSNTVFVLANPLSGQPTILSSLCCLPDTAGGFSEAAEIHLDPQASALWVSHRGQDALVQIPLLEDRLLPPRAWTDLGAHPRHFWLSHETLVIAAKDDDVVRVIRRDAQGLPDLQSVQRLSIPSPVFILPLRHGDRETS